MNMINNIERFTDKEWEELASILSEEKSEPTDLLSRFNDEDHRNTAQHWKGLIEMKNEKEINVDRAWEKVSLRLKESKAEPFNIYGRSRFLRSTIMKVAAIAVVIIGIGSAILYLNNNGTFSKRITVVTNNSQMNLQVKLPDGSNIFLNRNTRLSYKANLGKSDRNVTLSGEAFFDISPDASNPFTVYADKATIKVLGTSFNVISENNDSAVEVYVKTGKVMLSDNSGSQNLVLDPGFIGTMDSKRSEKMLNTNANYMSWNTGKLIYEGQKLDVVFHDLKRIFDIDIISKDPEILNQPLTANFDNEPVETKIRIICATFNLSYKKDGDIYHLEKK
jgi:transmembrane sensor